MSDYKKISNPFIHSKGNEYYCFGCSPLNQEGLLMEFYSDGEKLYADWTPEKRFEGYHNVIHGGIQATIMDEIASWTIYALIGTAGVTQKMDVNYHRPLYASHGNVKVKSVVKKHDEKIATIYVEVINSNNIVCSSADVVYYLFPPVIAINKYNYPGKDAFWK